MRFFRIDNGGVKTFWAYYKIKTDRIAISLCLTALYHVSTYFTMNSLLEHNFAQSTKFRFLTLKVKFW